MVRKTKKVAEFNTTYMREEILNEISRTLHGLDEVKKSLDKKFETMLHERCGTSLTFLGPAGSGKRSFIRRICKRYSDQIELIEHNANFDDITSAKENIHNLETLLKEKKNACYVIYNFENFRGTFGKNVLYTLAQNCRHTPLLLILVGESQKGLSLFEKRIASRLSSDVIYCFPLNTPEACYDFFKNMIIRATKQFSIADDIKLPEEIPLNFHKLCRLTPVYPKLKLLAKNFTDYQYDHGFEKSSTDIINDLIEVQTNEDLYRSLKERITERQYSLLVAAAVICPSPNVLFPITRVRQEHHNILNKYRIKDTTLVFDSDAEFQCDVRELIFNGFFVAKYQGKKIWYLGWNIYPKPFFNDELLGDVKEHFKVHLKEASTIKAW